MNGESRKKKHAGFSGPLTEVVAFAELPHEVTESNLLRVVGHEAGLCVSGPPAAHLLAGKRKWGSEGKR